MRLRPFMLILAALVTLGRGGAALAATPTCTTSAECGKNQQCDGAAGCAAAWTCVAARPCTMDLVPYCGCDGKTFHASSTCAGRKYAHRGACKPPTPKSCATTADCAKGQTCDGPAGCGAAWTCQPARACTKDRRPFCGCDGKTFFGSSSCPERRYARPGPCEEPRSCTSSAHCPKGQMCLGPEGCAAAWTCQPARSCTKDLATFCGCTGQTFEGSSSCPPQPYAHRGQCGPIGSPARGRTCTSSDVCARGETCQGAAGCTTPWTCMPARPCTRDVVSFCGCDGKTFQGSSTCPPRPHARRGRCDALSPSKKP